MIDGCYKETFTAFKRSRRFMIWKSTNHVSLTWGLTLDAFLVPLECSETAPRPPTFFREHDSSPSKVWPLLLQIFRGTELTSALGRPDGVGTIDNKCEDGRFLVSRRCVTISNPPFAFQKWKRGYSTNAKLKSSHLIDLDVKKPLVVSILRRSEELRL
jgi:hypothetical protein